MTRASGTRPSRATGGPSNSTRARYAHTNLGNAQEGPVGRGHRLPQEAIELDPKSAHSVNLGNALREKGQLDEAIACYKRAIELDPEFASAHSGLGLALLGKGQLDEAIACYKKAIELDPKLAAAHANLGWALSSKGKLGEAIACFKKAIELDPKIVTTRW